MIDTRESRYILATIVCASFALTIIIGAVSIALPSMAQDLSLSAIQMGWVPMLFSLTTAILILPFGRMADILGRVRIYRLGIYLTAGGIIVTACSISASMLIACQFLLGLAFSMISSTTPALITSASHPHNRGRNLGIYVSSIYLGTALGPSLGGLLTHNFGWRSIFVPTLLLLIPIIVLVSTKIKSEWADAKNEKFDITGSILISVMLFCLLYGFSQLPSTRGVWVIAAGVVSIVLFVLWELRVESPILNISYIVKNRLFSFSSLTHLLYYTATYPITFIMSLYLQYIKGYNSQEAGLILLITPVIMAVVSPLAGRTSDRIQPRVNVSAAITVVLIAVLLLFTATSADGLASIIIALVLLGAGYAFFVSPNTNAIMSSVDKKYYGVASASLATARQTGQTLGMSIIMLLFSLFIGNVQISPAYYPAFLQSVRTGFLVFAGVCIVSIAFSSARGLIRGDRR